MAFSTGPHKEISVSGGSYDYFSYKLEETASKLRSYHADELHVVALAAHLDRIASVMHDIEWADSCDTSWTPELDAAIRALVSPAAELEIALERARQAKDALDNALTRAAAPSQESEETT
jgi:hypothetical protein